MVAVLVYAGLRREELHWLTVDDVDLSRRQSGAGAMVCCGYGPNPLPVKLGSPRPRSIGPCRSAGRFGDTLTVTPCIRLTVAGSSQVPTTSDGTRLTSRRSCAPLTQRPGCTGPASTSTIPPAANLPKLASASLRSRVCRVTRRRFAPGTTLPSLTSILPSTLNLVLPCSHLPSLLLY